mgnify:CR=1 FL=1
MDLKKKNKKQRRGAVIGQKKIKEKKGKKL